MGYQCTDEVSQDSDDQTVANKYQYDSYDLPKYPILFTEISYRSGASAYRWGTGRWVEEYEPSPAAISIIDGIETNDKCEFNVSLGNGQQE